MSASIGIGITTRNRPQVFEKSLKEIKKYAPANAKLVIVDDCSSVPVLAATFRFEENVGIATAKNKCLELLDDCEHIFLFDDDTYPLVENWYEPYINSGQPHLMYQFKLGARQRSAVDMLELYRDDKIVSYTHTRGCMIYLQHSVLDYVGGFDTRYFVMYEHTDLTNRIYNAGLTSHRAMDVVGSDQLLYCLDQDGVIESSIGENVRRVQISSNRKLYQLSKTSSEYRSYK